MTELAKIPMRYRVADTGFPKGWYCVADSADIPADTLVPVSYLGQQLIVYRTADGKAQVADAYCPHLGAHLASHDGCIKSGEIICPFHKWHFNGADGQVASIPYSNVPPGPHVKLTLYPTHEGDGTISMWYSPNAGEPEFPPYDSPELKNGTAGWSLFTVKTFESTCPFRDVLENLYDGAHIVQLHNGKAMPEVEVFEQRPYGLYTRYKADPGEEMRLTRFEFNIGGLSKLVQNFGGENWETLFITTFTPIDEERFRQTARLYIKEMGDAAMREMIGKAFTERYTFEVDQDFRVLDYKKHLSRPRLCAGDGPILKFRRYAAQFFNGVEPAEA